MRKRSILSSLAALILLTIPVNAGAVIVNNANYDNRCVPLGNSVTSTIFDIDATCAASYVGTGQAFNSLEPTPADSTTQASNLFDVGDSASATATDPTFSGTPGATNGVFTNDGGDYFELNTSAASMNAFYKNIGKTTGGQDFWLGVTFYHQTAVSTKGVAGNSSSSTTPGIYLTVNSAEQISFAQRGDSATVTNLFLTPVLSNNTWYTVILSYSHTTDTVALWVNSATGATASMTFNAGTTDASAAMRIMRSAGSNAIANTQLRWAGMGNTYIDDTEAAKIFSALETRHSTDYTP